MALEKVAAFGRFWYDFIVGDDWSIALGVVVLLIVTRLLHEAGLGVSWVVLLAGVLLLLADSVRRARRTS